MPLVAVMPHLKIPGFDGRRTGVPQALQVMEVQEALMRVWHTEACAVSYVVPGATRQPRIIKRGLPNFGVMPEVQVLFCDLDNSDHREWTPELHDAALERYERVALLETVGIYHTKHGARLVQPLVKPVPADQAERYIASWYADLARAGLEPDDRCRDWTHLFRLPHVMREGEQLRPSFMRLDRMQPVEVEPLPEASPGRMRSASNHSPAPPSPVPNIDWRSEVPEDWRHVVGPLAEAIQQVQTEWHSLFLALSGALLRRGVPSEQLPALVRAISAATGADTRADDRVEAARTTVRNHLAGEPVTGFTTLSRDWPLVAAALETAQNTPPPPPLAESQSAMRDVLREAPEGLTLLAAECGLGKTAAAIDVAAENARRTHQSPTAESTRAPLFSKTAISVDKHRLAKQIVTDLAEKCIQARRLFGPLSLRHPDGTPVCQLHDVARHLVGGGQPMQWELCRGRDIEPCPHYDDCPACEGAEGPEDARVTVGPHQLIGALANEAGTTGLLVIDEPPDLLEMTPLRATDLEHALSLLHAFEATFASAMAPTIEALAVWLARLGQPDTCVPLPDAVAMASEAISPATLEYARNTCGFEGTALDYAQAAQPDERTGQAPPLRFMQLKLARGNVAYARKLGRASRVLGALYHALSAHTPAAVALDEGRGGPMARLITVRDTLSRALTRDGRVVAMDASIEVNAPIFAKAVGYPPPLHRFSSADGAPIRRLHIRRKSAVRKHWLPRGKLVLAPGLIQSLRDILEFAEGTATLGMITMHTIERALRAALEPDAPQHDAAWREARQSPDTLAQVREALSPILQAYPGTIVFGHYGAVRGLNHMKDVDCLATLGDPWPNLGRVRHEVAFLGLSDNWEARMIALCKAELEQAHGRLRAVHRQLPARAIHIGSVRPGGHGWSTGSVELRMVKPGRPTPASTMTADEVAIAVKHAGGVRALARRTGLSRSSISRYLHGAAVPSESARKIRIVTDAPAASSRCPTNV